MIRNETRNTILAEHARLAASLVWRMRGMIGRRFDDFDALVFEHNNSIHMFFMGMPLDIIFLDSEQRVISVRLGLRPWRLAMAWRAATVVELPVGAIAASLTQPGDQLQLNPDSRR